jgi:hypothetical protein
MAAAIDDMRFGLHRALRKIRQDFSRATPRSTGAGEHPAAHMTCESVEEHVFAHPETGRMPIGPVLGLRRERGAYFTPTDPDLLLAHIS